MRASFVKALCELAASDERVWLLTADLGYSALEVYSNAFPNRFVNVGVAEQNMIGVAAGLAHCGKIVFTYTIGAFSSMRCLEQIRNDVCYHHANVKLIANGCGFSYGPQGFTHHSVEDIAVLRALPEMTIVAPGDETEAALATKAIAERVGPCYLRLGHAPHKSFSGATSSFRLGRATLLQAGSDMAFVSTGAMLELSLQSATALKAVGLEASVYSMHTIKPLDIATLEMIAQRTSLIITVEEHRLIGGLGSAVAEVLTTVERISGCRLIQYALPDRLTHALGSRDELRRQAGNLVDIALSHCRQLAAKDCEARKSLV